MGSAMEGSYRWLMGLHRRFEVAGGAPSKRGNGSRPEAAGVSGGEGSAQGRGPGRIWLENARAACPWKGGVFVSQHHQGVPGSGHQVVVLPDDRFAVAVVRRNSSHQSCSGPPTFRRPGLHASASPSGRPPPVAAVLERRAP